MMVTYTQLDALQELVDAGVRQAAHSLNNLLGCHLCLHVPVLSLLPLAESRQELKQRLGNEQVSVVRLRFSSSFSGIAQLVFPRNSALKLVSALTSETLDLPAMNTVKVGTLSEVGNIVLHGVMGVMSTVLKQKFQYSIPVYLEERAPSLIPAIDPEGGSDIVLAQARFSAEPLLVQGDMILLFWVGSFQTLLKALDGKHESDVF